MKKPEDNRINQFQHSYFPFINIMEELLEPEARLLSLQSTHLIDINMGQPWLQIHSKMQRTIEVHNNQRTKAVSLFKNPANIQETVNRLHAKTRYGPQKKQKYQKPRIGNKVVKNQLKIMLNSYNEHSFCSTPASERVRLCYQTKETDAVIQNKENRTLLENLEKKQLLKLSSSKFKSLSHSAVLSMFNIFQKSKKERILVSPKHDYISNRPNNIQLPSIFHARQQSKTSPQAKQPKFHTVLQGSKVEYTQKKPASAVQCLNQQIQSSKFVSIANTTGLNHPQSQNIAIDNVIENQPVDRTRRQLREGSTSKSKLRTIHSLDFLRKNDGKLNVLRLRHHSLEKLRISMKKKEALAKQNVKNKEKLVSQLKNLKIVKNRLCLNLRINALISTK